MPDYTAPLRPVLSVSSVASASSTNSSSSYRTALETASSATATSTSSSMYHSAAEEEEDDDDLVDQEGGGSSNSTNSESEGVDPETVKTKDRGGVRQMEPQKVRFVSHSRFSLQTPPPWPSSGTTSSRS